MDIPQWIKVISSKEEDIKCIRKIHVETVNEEMKGRSSEEKEIRIHKCRRISRFEIMSKEVIVRIYLSKQQGGPTKITKTKEEIRLEHMKRMVKREAL